MAKTKKKSEKEVVSDETIADAVVEEPTGVVDECPDGDCPPEDACPANLTDWQQRVVDERDQLQVRIKALSEFVGCDSGSCDKQYASLDQEEKDLLNSQLNCMKATCSILCQRIERFC